MNLLKLREVLVKNKPDYPINFTIPTILNKIKYKDGNPLSSEELLINPYDYLIELLDQVFLKNYQPLEVKSLSQIKNSKVVSGGEWIKQSVVYSMLIRTSSAWDHDRNGKLELNNMYNLRETGTFLKTIAILPYLKEIGVNALYLLPISKYSRKNMKGELGSPYGVSSFFELEPNLSDPMIENEISIDEQFKLLVEAAHLLDMRVLIDIIPRTNAIENDLIVTNPDWFYWIKTSDLKKYKPPQVKELPGKTIPPVKEHMETVYKNKNVIKHINLFQHNPKTIDPKKWELVLEENKNSNESILDIVDKHFGLTVAPAFSDHINDNQPPWSDITFFRMYLDHPIYTKQFLKDTSTPPYILFDTIKSNLYEGNKPNKELWDLIANIIPHYQKTFGVDGVRIDMGHALPEKLINMILDNARKIDPDFTFIAEELNPDNDKIAKELGYNMIIGNAFSMIWNKDEEKMHEFIYGQPKRILPSFAAPETHDTPRIAARDGEEILSRFLTILSMFLPNTVPFINSGQEIFEKQPINTGIDPREKDLLMLDKDDPYYKKLALFDKYAFHYTNKENFTLLDDLKKVSKIRKKYLNHITNIEKYMRLDFLEGHQPIGFAYELKNEILLIIGNPQYNYSQHFKIDLKNIRKKFNLENKGLLLFATHEKANRVIKEFDENKNPYFLMGPGEVKIFTIKKDD